MPIPIEKVDNDGFSDNANTFCLNGHIETPAVKTYVLLEKAPFDFDIVGLTTLSPTGTIASLDIEIDDTNVTGITAVDATAVQQTDLASGANSVAADSRVTLVVNTNGGTPSGDFSFTLECIKT